MNTSSVGGDTAPTTSQFTSTRNKRFLVAFWQSVIQGMAPDGGLLIPQHLPTLPKGFFTNARTLGKLSVSDISTELHRLFIPRNIISDQELKAMMHKAHNFDIPMESLDAYTSVLRLDRGPTASFKDLAARSLAALIEHYCATHAQPINIVVATSGDTGVAIADAFGGSRYVSVTVLYPTEGVSEVQEKQMLMVHHHYDNEQVIPIRGNFDACQDIAKLLQAARTMDVSTLAKEVKAKLGMKLSTEETRTLSDTVRTLNLSSANSINIWRLIPQMTQYVTAYAALVRNKRIQAGEEVVFAVPSGNVGHLMAGIYARALGLPVKRFVVGTNANNILANVIGSGIIKHRDFTNTSAPSMDILDPSNLERLLTFAAQATGLTKPIDFSGMKQSIKENRDPAGVSLRSYGVSAQTLSFLQKLIWAEDIETDAETYAMMEYAAHTYGVVLEPHGTTGLIATLRARAKREIDATDQVIIFETAHPDKFPDALFHARLTRAKHYKHPVLAKLARQSLTTFRKPAASAPDVLKIARRIASIAIH